MDRTTREITIRFTATDEETTEVEQDIRDTLGAAFPIGALTLSSARIIELDFILVSRKARELRRGDRCPQGRPRRYENAAEVSYIRWGADMVFVTYMDGQTVEYEPEQTVKVWREIRSPN